MPDYRETLEALKGDGFTMVRTELGDEPIEAHLGRAAPAGSEVAVERHDVDGVARIFRIVEEGHREEPAIAVVYTDNGYGRETICPDDDPTHRPRRPAA